MKKQKILWICFLLCLGLWMVPERAFAKEGGYRALIIGRGDYGGVNDLSPGPENDSENFQRVLEQAYGSEIAITKKEKEGVTTASGVASAIQEAFAGSSQDTVNYFYYCGHGNSSGLYLGSATMTASMLAEAFEGIAGTNILVIDCCFSGTLVSRTGRSGVREEAFLDSFIQEFTDTLRAMKRGRSAWGTGSFHILTAASGEEQSWQGELGERGEDIGLFTSNLALGVGVNPMKIADQDAYDMGIAPADYDRDGSITFDEIVQFIRNGNYSSNLRRYPESDTAVFLETAERSAPDVTVKKSWVTWEDGERVLKILYDAREPGEIQCAAYRGELWNLSCLCRYVKDSHFSSQSSSKIKRVGIWTKEAEAGEHTLSVPLPETDEALTEGNYAVMVRGGESTAYTYMLPLSLLASEGTELAESLQVTAEPYFCIDGKKEFQLLADFGTGSSEKLIRPYLSAVVKDEAGGIVRVLADHELVDVVQAYQRPYRYYRGFYWDGRDGDGAAVEPGLYKAELTVHNGMEEITVSRHVLTTGEGNPVTGIEIVNGPSQTEYQEGETFNPEGMQVAANLRQGEQIPLAEYQVEEKGTLNLEDDEIVVSYGAWRASVPITVRTSERAETEISKEPETEAPGTWQPVQAATVKLSAEGKSVPGKGITIGIREKVRLSAAVSPANAVNKNVTFQSSNPKVASVGAGGVITGKKKGSAKITAITANGKRRIIKVTVKKAPSKFKLKSVKKTLKRNKKYRVKAVLPKKAASYHLTYKSSRRRVASVSSNGTVTAKKKGTAVITVQTYNKKKAKVKIIVK